jgi:hypothetical protein
VTPARRWRKLIDVADRVFRYSADSGIGEPVRFRLIDDGDIPLRVKSSSFLGLEAIRAGDVEGIILALLNVGYYSRDPEGLSRILHGHRMATTSQRRLALAQQRRAADAGGKARRKVKKEDGPLVAQRYGELKANGVRDKEIDPIMHHEFGITGRRARDYWKLFSEHP